MSSELSFGDLVTPEVRKIREKNESMKNTERRSTVAMLLSVYEVAAGRVGVSVLEEIVASKYMEPLEIELQKRNTELDKDAKAVIEGLAKKGYIELMRGREAGRISLTPKGVQKAEEIIDTGSLDDLRKA